MSLTISQNRIPTWRPISDLSLVEKGLNGTLKSSEEQYALLLKAREQIILDEHSIKRIIRLFNERAEYIKFYAEQVKRWEAISNITSSDQAKLSEFNDKIKRTKELNDNVLNLAKELENLTIDKIVSMDDVELAVNTLSGAIPSMLKSSKK